MTRPLRILMVEDSIDDAMLVSQALKSGDFDPTVRRVETEEEMQAALSSGGWDLVIADHSLPQFDAARALRVLHEHQLDLPFIIVSGAISDVAAVEAMRSGAHDYVRKEQLIRLAPAVEREIMQAFERQRQRHAEARIEYLAHHDDATGLPNRAMLVEALDELIQQAQYPPRALVAVAIHIEWLDAVAETFGHHYRDLLLREVAARLRAIVPEASAVARVGEDRLGLALPLGVGSEAAFAGWRRASEQRPASASRCSTGRTSA
jgi:PleD family two-component response regulator